MISGNYNNRNNQTYNIQYGAIKDVVPDNLGKKLPENIQNIDAKEIANNNGAIAAAGKIDKKSALLTVPIYASFIALRNLNDGKSHFSFAGEYNKTFLGKLAKLGDKITHGVKLIIPDSFENFVKKKSKSAKSWILEHSAIARSFTTPIKYENKLAMSEANGLFGRVMGDNATMFEEGFRGGFDELKKLFGENTEIWKLFKKEGIENFKTDPKSARSVVAKVLRNIGNQPLNDASTKQYAREIIENFSKSDQRIIIDSWKLPFFNIPIGKIPILGKHLTLNVPASEMSNKLRVAANVSGKDLGEVGAAALGTTMLGRSLPSSFAKIYEGLTSDYVGGKLAPIMQAYFLTSAIIRAKDAPKGQKLATFMDEEVSAVSFLFTMPLATSLLARTGGLKYLGMGKNKAAQDGAVNAFRNAVAALNKKVDMGTISRGEYALEAKKIKDMLKGKTRFYQKPLKFIGKILGSNFKDETIKPFIENTIPAGTSSLKAFGIKASNRVQQLLYNFKTKGILGQTPGGLLRFALVMFVLSPLVSKPINWVVHKIFGKPYKPDANKKADKNNKNENGANISENPFANLTEEEMINLLKKNQANMMKAEKNPELLQELESDPKKLYDFLVQGAEEYDKKLASQAPSPLLQSYIDKTKNSSAQTTGLNGDEPYFVPIQNRSALNVNNFNPNSKMPAPSVQQMPTTNAGRSEKTPEYNRSYSYIPSSTPAKSIVEAQNIQDDKLNSILKGMEDTEKAYSKYLNL